MQPLPGRAPLALRSRAEPPDEPGDRDRCVERRGVRAAASRGVAACRSARACGRRPAHRRLSQHAAGVAVVPGTAARASRAGWRSGAAGAHLRRAARTSPAARRRHRAIDPRPEGASRAACDRSAVPVGRALARRRCRGRRADRHARRRNVRTAGDQALRWDRRRAGPRRSGPAEHAAERASARRGRSLRPAGDDGCVARFARERAAVARAPRTTSRSGTNRRSCFSRGTAWSI